MLASREPLIPLKFLLQFTKVCIQLCGACFVTSFYLLPPPAKRMFLNFSISNVRCFQALTEQVDLFGRGRGELVPRVFFFMFCILIGGAYVEIRHGEEVSAQRLILLFYILPSQYMEKEDAVNILQFWLAADNFQSQLAAKKGQYDGQEAQNDAMILYDK